MILRGRSFKNGDCPIGFCTFSHMEAQMEFDGGKMAPRWPTIVPRWPQEAPIWHMAQDGPAMAQDSPKMASRLFPKCDFPYGFSYIFAHGGSDGL